MQNQFPRYLIGYNIEYINMFIELLSKSTEVCQREVLSLLENLPYNNDVKDYLQKNISQLTPEAKIPDWDRIMQYDGKNLSHTAYSLMCLEEMLMPKRNQFNQEQEEQENQKKMEFCIKFLKTNGFFFL
mmetsp:Transcript_8862/g.8235  ORF Transcript_8862/g.8235 Transcript_8862/m.8235 type:complete len:129 (+) Transcript_8862:3075-3461(+)